MSVLDKLKAILLKKRPVTSDYRHSSDQNALLRVDEIPPFNLQIADLMRSDSQVRIGLGARNGMLATAEVDVIGDNSEVALWVERQWDRIWSTSAHQLLRAKLYGFVPFEVMYRQAKGGPYDGAVEFDHLNGRHPRDARILVRNGQPIGFSLRVKGSKTVRVLTPKALLVTFDAEFGNPYGCALLERAYSPWYEKWMEGGAKKTLRLRMIKDAYIGDILWYPPDRKIELPDGADVSWRDVAREMVETRSSGAAMTLPLMRDRDGNKLIEYTPPQDIGGATHIFQWKKDVDIEIWKALEIPPEIIEASAHGAGYAGRSIPYAIAQNAVQLEFAEIIRSVDRDILRPLAHLNFGVEPQYDIRPRKLTQSVLQAETQTPLRPSRSAPESQQSPEIVPTQ